MMETTSVTILGNNYKISGSTKENIKRYADFVDQKLMEINRHVHIDSTYNLAILCALNITEELFKEREKVKELNRKISELTHLFDNISQIS